MDGRWMAVNYKRDIQLNYLCSPLRPNLITFVQREIYVAGKNTHSSLIN